MPIQVKPEGTGYRISVLDGSSGLVHSGGVYAPDPITAVAVVAKLLDVPHDVQVESDVLDAMRECLSQS
jgi:hypothetical protein